MDMPRETWTTALDLVLAIKQRLELEAERNGGGRCGVSSSGSGMPDGGGVAFRVLVAGW